MAILLLRPVCEAAEPLNAAGSGSMQVDSAHGQDNPAAPDSCCASIHGVSITAAALAVPGLAKLSPLLPALSAVSQHAAPEIWRPALGAPPPRGLPYHARSARLLL